MVKAAIGELLSDGRIMWGMAGMSVVEDEG